MVSDRRRSAAVSSFSDDDSRQFRRLSQCRHVRTDAMASISLLLFVFCWSEMGRDVDVDTNYGELVTAGRTIKRFSGCQSVRKKIAHCAGKATSALTLLLSS